MRLLKTALVAITSWLVTRAGLVLAQSIPCGVGVACPDITLPNPLAPTTDIAELITTITSTLAWYIAPPIAGIVAMVGAYQIMFAAGDEEKFKTGKRTVLYAFIGYGIVLLALGAVSLIKSIVYL